MPKSLADGRTKVTLLTTKPADPYAPTLAELEAGIEASCRIVASDYSVGPGASETVGEKELCKEGSSVAFGASTATIEFSPFRYFDEDGSAEVGTAEADIGDAVYQATKTKGAYLWLYQRETSKKSTAPWAAGDEVDGFEFVTDNPQSLERTGYIKKRVVGGFQDMFLDGTVAGSSGGGS